MKTHESYRHWGGAGGTCKTTPEISWRGGHGHVPEAHTPLEAAFLQPVITSVASRELYFHYIKEQSDKEMG